ncbi:MAG TPA: hypothetical protein VFZ85_19710 [Jiangellaceae bacterium]
MSRDDDQIWAELVESFHASSENQDRQWPAAENVDPEVPNTSDDKQDEPAKPTGSHTVGEKSGVAVPDTDEHFVPPPPPPLPSTDLITRAAWASVLGVPIFLTLVVLLRISVSGWIAALCAGAFIGGFVVLVARLRGHDPYDPDDGAVV